jgi:integrase
MERLCHLRVLMELDVLKASLRWHMTRKNLLADKKIDAQLMTFVATAYSVANYLRVAHDERLKLKAFLDKLQPQEQPEGLIDRHDRILDELENPRTRAMLLHLPSRLMREARRLRGGWTDKRGAHAPRPHDAAWIAGIAVAVEIELHAPLRLTDLSNIRLGHELRLSGSGASRWIGNLHVARTSKTGKGIQVPLQLETIRLIREYLDHFRPLLRHASGVWLFPGEVSVDRPRAASAFGTAISENAAEYVGLRVNPHAFRCIAGALILEANPHALDDVRAILGHATFNTTLRYYLRFRTRAAATRLGQTISGLRRDSSSLNRLPGRLVAPAGKAGKPKAPPL